MICEGKTYSKKIKIDQLGKDDQVIVRKNGTDEMVAQYFCHKGNCSSDPVGCLKMESGYLLLIMDSVNHSDRFDAFQNRKKILQNFTLDEEPPQTTKMPEAPTGEALSTAAKVAIGILGAVGLAVIAVIAYKVYCRRTRRDRTIDRVARRIAREPVKEVGNPIEMEDFVPNSDRV